MNPYVSAFTVVYSAWRDVFRSMIPGGTDTQAETPKAVQAVAEQEWEDEGGSLKPEKK